jgi:hypothetical protein
MEPKAKAVYNVKTMASIYIGRTTVEVPVEFRILEMPWDEGKSVEQMIQEAIKSSVIEVSMKKKHLSVKKIV